MDKYKEIEDLIAFKDVVCTKEILNSQSMRTEIKANEVIKMDMVIIGEMLARVDTHYIDLYFYSFLDENIKSSKIIFEGTIHNLKGLIKTLFIPVKSPKWTLLNFLEFIDIEDIPFVDAEEKERAVSLFLKNEIPYIVN